MEVLCGDYTQPLPGGAPPLFRALLNALQALKAHRRAGEENKAIRHCYQLLSWLAGSTLLGEGEAMATLHKRVAVTQAVAQFARRRRRGKLGTAGADRRVDGDVHGVLLAA